MAKSELDKDGSPRNQCEECGSPYVPEASAMDGLCTECAHWLYGYANCAHVMTASGCSLCGWNGAVSAYVASLRAQGPSND
jgi:hypothetical protein